jgi:hypothetical protein
MARVNTTAWAPPSPARYAPTLDLRDDRGTAAAGAGQIDDLGVVAPDEAIQVYVEQVLPRRGSPVPEKTGLDVVGLEGLTQGRVVDQIDLTDRELIRGAPVHIDQIQLAG